MAAHEQAMREQAKKMNVASLRSGDQSGESAEIKLAKVTVQKIALTLDRRYPKSGLHPFFLINKIIRDLLANYE